LPDFRRFRFSYEKVEKVVKPPQKPVARNNFRLLSAGVNFNVYPITRPRIKLPVMFMIKVAAGNDPGLITSVTA
jgi:hypothetical protein